MAESIPQEGWKRNAGVLKGPGIPAPSGQYRVGCVDLMHQLEGDDKGGLLLRLYYPTDATEDSYPYSLWSPHKNYLKGYLEAASARFPGLKSNLINILVSPKIPALEGAPVLGSNDKMAEAGEIDEAPPTFPVIVFSHGLGAMRTTSSAIICDLASHGYVVAAVEHREATACASLQRVPDPGRGEGEFQDQWIEYISYGTAEDPSGDFSVRNKQLNQRADEAKKSLDILNLINEGAEVNDMLGGGYDFQKLKGRMDIATAAIIGHSFGAVTTIQTLSEDTRFKCGIALDCWMFPLDEDFYKNPSSVTQPLYFINSFDFQWKENVQKIVSLTKPPDANGMSPCRVLTINDTNHDNQTDFFFVFPRSFISFVFGGDSSSRLDITVAHTTNLEICHAFLKRHLLKTSQGSVPNLDGTGDHSKHIIFGTNVDLTDIPAAVSNGDGAAGAEEEGRS